MLPMWKCCQCQFQFPMRTSDFRPRTSATEVGSLKSEVVKFKRDCPLPTNVVERAARAYPPCRTGVPPVPLMEAAGDMHNGYTYETGSHPLMLQNYPRNLRLSVSHAVREPTRSSSEDKQKRRSLSAFSAEGWGKTDDFRMV